MKIRSVHLELLRPGPPHNQLLSPLTSYIALCGDEPPETFHVPFEHYRILQRIQSLRPPRTPTEIQAALTELRQDVVEMLCGIRCLATSLAEAHGDGVDLIELELVLSASELSLIPFEIAFYPGSPTRELAHREVIVMRRSRRVPRGRLWWEQRPRVLIAAASPPGFAPVPIEAHVRGIREALAPWLTYLDGHEGEDELILREMSKFCVVLPNASELAIQEKVEEAARDRHPFTHLHVLAHGGEISADVPEETASVFSEPRFGLVLHDSRDPAKRDTLSGRRVFSALAGSNQQCERKLPQVVTLASCDSANIGGVVVPGASIAHDIHDGGVPLVVASQLPLSYAGSVVFVKRLYERLLAGDDPRCALRETRRAIFASASRELGPVDWGAIVQYGALPHELEKHVKQATIRAAKQRVDAALSSVDDTVVPQGKSDVVKAWKHACDGLDILEAYADEPDVFRYVARTRLRWAFIVRHAKPSVDMQSVTRDATQEKPDPNQPLELNPLRNLRLFRDGSLRYYRATSTPFALVEYLIARFFVHDSIPLTHVTAAMTQCTERIELDTLSKDARRKHERGLIYLWILAPVVEGGAGDGLDLALSMGRGDRWYEAVLSNQFVDAPSTRFEYFAMWKQCTRIVEIAQDDVSKRPAAEVVKTRAGQVQAFLELNGVRTTFSAIVDWRDEGDGGTRTVAT